MNKKENPCLGSTFESYLKEHGVLEETKDDALLLYLAYKVRMALKELGITQTELAKRMNTSRADVRRLVDLTTKEDHAQRKSLPRQLTRRNAYRGRPT